MAAGKEVIPQEIRPNFAFSYFVIAGLDPAIHAAPGRGVPARRELPQLSLVSYPTPNSLAYVRFLEDFSVTPFANVWTDTQTGAFTDEKIYVVQTNTKVVERCILMCTNPGDLVLDPTCGSGTTAYVAEQWGRRWITTDTSRVALTLARGRLMGAKYDYYLLKDSKEGAEKEGEITGKPWLLTLASPLFLTAAFRELRRFATDRQGEAAPIALVKGRSSPAARRLSLIAPS